LSFLQPCNKFTAVNAKLYGHILAKQEVTAAKAVNFGKSINFGKMQVAGASEGLIYGCKFTAINTKLHGYKYLHLQP
jgi:hypothetical protein